MYLLERTNLNFGKIDGSEIAPERFAGLGWDSIQRIELSVRSERVALNKVFRCTRIEGPDDTTVLLGNCAEIDRIAVGMKSGTICILGDVGASVASEVVGGTMIVIGDTGDCMAQGLRGGTVFVQGNCGDRLGAPLAGHKSGMRGGDLIVIGDVGQRAFERMRRGTALVTGDIGSHAAAQMIAGTVCVLGHVGPNWGGGLKRGSLIFAQDVDTDSAGSWSEPRDFELSFLPLVWRHLKRLLERLAVERQEIYEAISKAVGTSNHEQLLAPTNVKIPSTRWVQRQIGDVNHSGRGEMLTLRRATSTPSTEVK